MKSIVSILSAVACSVGTQAGAAQPAPSFLMPVAREVKANPSAPMQKLIEHVAEHHLTECLSDALQNVDLAELQARKDKLEVFHISPPKESTDMFHHALILERGTERFWILRSGGIGGAFHLYRGEQTDNVHC